MTRADAESVLLPRRESAHEVELPFPSVWSSSSENLPFELKATDVTNQERFSIAMMEGAGALPLIHPLSHGEQFHARGPVLVTNRLVMAISDRGPSAGGSSIRVTEPGAPQSFQDSRTGSKPPSSKALRKPRSISKRSST